MADPNTHDLKNQQLLSAYLDGELGSADRALAENLIRENPQYAQLVEQWRESGIDLRALPKHRLDDQFADRVLDEVDHIGEPSGPVVAQEQPSIDSPSPSMLLHTSTKRSGDFAAVIAISVLCASLLLTLFVFPALFGSPSTDSTALKPSSIESAETTRVTEPKTELKSEVASPVKSSNSGAQTSSDPPLVSPGVSSQVPIRRVPRGMRMANTQVEGGAVPALELNQPAQNVEQVLYIKVPSANREQLDIEKVLNNHSIKTAEAKESDSTSARSDGEVIYAVASLAQMRRAAEQLATEFSAEVTIVSVPSATISVGQATRLKSSNFSGQSTSAEIAELDQWFGLTETANDSRPIRFLILSGF